MKRRLTKLVVFLLLGAIVNVGVAWGFAVWSDEYFDALEPKAAPQVVLDQLTRLGWKPTAESDDWFYTHSILKWRSYGVSDSFVVENAVWKENSRLVKSSEFSFEFHFASIFQVGWPLRCLSREHFDPSGNGQAATNQIWPYLPSQASHIGEIPIDRRSVKPMANWQHSMSLPVPEIIGPIELPADRHLPLRPIWGGLIINSIVYAAILLMMMFIASMAKQRRRFKKGHCPKCNYELRSDYSTGCPECGWRRDPGDVE